MYIYNMKKIIIYILLYRLKHEIKVLQKFYSIYDDKYFKFQAAYAYRKLKLLKKLSNKTILNDNTINQIKLQYDNLVKLNESVDFTTRLKIPDFEKL